ncbi:flavodoxin [Boudabousia liubingyangii]|uniref:Flavodoxin n=1 Tax=Boudabousia liubingyangii TaxID=1921764 RepID=A0A1Q5PKK3_9ACTO|nr:flavodoxin domain-containing protein [Boudabousia liubingyangii]OKL46512.1 flavodoxin [Boudabousia liubingyangii]OKL47167.1 flavodoxin [Boudabousia liubingyangii]
MKILVAAASKHGSTLDVRDRIAKALSEGGHEVVTEAPQNVETLEGYDAVVLGSAVYITQWMSPAKDFIARFTEELRHLPVWAFSVGLSGVPKGNVQDPSRVGPALIEVAPVEQKTFAGKLDPTKLNLRERSIARLGGAIEGDYRDWAEIDAFAQRILAYFEAEPER